MDVVIVDDDARFRRQVRAMLVADGLAVVGEAATLERATELLHTIAHGGSPQAPHPAGPIVALVDIGLPDGDGFEVARRVADRYPAQLVIVILMSSRDRSVYARQLASSPAIGFIPKDELSGAAVRDFVGTPRATV